MHSPMQGFRAEPRDRSVCLPSTKTPLLVLSWGLLLLPSTPKSLAGEGPTQPPGGVWLQATQWWSGQATQRLEWPAPRERHDSGLPSPSPVKGARPAHPLLAARDPST